jgi:hypothetical protein
MTKPPVVARFLKSKTAIEIPGAPAFSLIGSDLTQLGGVERGTRNATYEYLLRLARSLDTSVGEITTLADTINKQPGRPPA